MPIDVFFVQHIVLFLLLCMANDVVVCYIIIIYLEDYVVDDKYYKNKNRK